MAVDIADPEKIFTALKEAGCLPDDKINLAETAILMGARYHPGLSMGRYHSHIQKLSREVGERYAALLEAGEQDDLPARLAALKHVFYDKEGYDVVKEPVDVQDSDITQVIDRRSATSTALALLMVHCGRIQGWGIDGLNVPGRFLLRLDSGTDRLIADPVNLLSPMQAHDLRRLVKKALGETAELSMDYYEPVTNRFFLLCLQNNIKTRQIMIEDYEGAYDSVRIMRAVAPEEYRLLLDEGVLSARTGRKDEAIAALEKYIEEVPEGRDRYDALMFLQEIRDNMP